MSKYIEIKVMWIWPCTVVSWWNMLMKFSEQIDKSLAKKINIKGKWSFSRKSFLGLQGNSEFCQTSEIVKNEKPFTIFCKNLHLGCLTRFWICFWTGLQSYGCFIFKSIWMLKVTDNLLGKKKKGPAELLK